MAVLILTFDIGMQLRHLLTLV